MLTPATTSRLSSAPGPLHPASQELPTEGSFTIQTQQDLGQVGGQEASTGKPLAALLTKDLSTGYSCREEGTNAACSQLRGKTT